MVHVEDQCTRGWGVFKWEPYGGKDYIARGQTGWRMSNNQRNHPRIRPSAKSACHRETVGHATHRLDPTQSNGCILQAAGTAAAVEVLQHRQTADFKRHV